MNLNNFDVLMLFSVTVAKCPLDWTITVFGVLMCCHVRNDDFDNNKNCAEVSFDRGQNWETHSWFLLSHHRVGLSSTSPIANAENSMYKIF